MRHFFQGYLDAYTQVSAAVHALARTSATTAEAAETAKSTEVKPGTKHRVQYVVDVETAETTGAATHLFGGEAELVVALALLRVAEHTVGLGCLLEFLLGILLLLLALALLTIK